MQLPPRVANCTCVEALSSRWGSGHPMYSVPDLALCRLDVVTSKLDVTRRSEWNQPRGFNSLQGG